MPDITKVVASKAQQLSNSTDVKKGVTAAANILAPGIKPGTIVDSAVNTAKTAAMVGIRTNPYTRFVPGLNDSLESAVKNANANDFKNAATTIAKGAATIDPKTAMTIMTHPKTVSVVANAVNPKAASALTNMAKKGIDPKAARALALNGATSMAGNMASTALTTMATSAFTAGRRRKRNKRKRTQRRRRR